jgi:hypothetical protein
MDKCSVINKKSYSPFANVNGNYTLAKYGPNETPIEITKKFV